MKRINTIALVEVLLLVLIVIGIYGSLQTMELRAEEPRRAVVAMEMMHGNNYIIPKLFNYNYYSKPPLFNWLIVLVFKITGSFNEIWVRLPSVLSLFLTAWLVFKVTTRTVNSKTGFIAAMLLLVSSDILFYGTVDAGEIDLFLMLLLFMQAIAVYYYSTKQQWWRLFLISYICMAAGALTKGLPVILVQALLLLCWFTYIKQFKKLFSIQHIAGVLIGFGLVYTYLAVYNTQANVFVFLAQLLTESTQRSALENKWSDIALNLLQSPLQVFYICLPATGLLIYAANRKVRLAVKRDRLFIFSLIITLIICILFFISPYTANRYLYPAFPFIAIMAAIIYSKAIENLRGSRWLISYKGLLVLFMMFAVVRLGYDIWGIPYQRQNLSTEYKALAAKILQHSGGQPVHLTGAPQVNTTHGIPFIKMQPQVVVSPPLLPYQLPYYIGKATGTLMQYDSLPVKGRFYLTTADFLKNNKATVYFTFFDDWTRRNVALVKF